MICGIAYLKGDARIAFVPSTRDFGLRTTKKVEQGLQAGNCRIMKINSARYSHLVPQKADLGGWVIKIY